MSRKPLTIENFVQNLASSLVDVRVNTRGLVVTLPILYPSGSHVTILVAFSGEKCVVSDDGAGFYEASLMGASDAYRRIAKPIAEQNGLAFSKFEIFEAEVDINIVPGMIAIIADASRQAVQVTCDKMFKRFGNNLKAIMINRLIMAFGEKSVSKDVAISGASSHNWTVDAVVEVGSKSIAVEAVSPSPISVSAAYMKLDDIRRLASAPTTVAVVDSRTSFAADQLVILGRTSRIVDSQSNLEDLRALAA